MFKNIIISFGSLFFVCIVFDLGTYIVPALFGKKTKLKKQQNKSQSNKSEGTE